MNASDDLLTRAAPTNDARALEGARDAAEDDSDATVRKTGILPSQELEYLTRVTREIFSQEPIQDDQYQPASLDLRLGPVAYRVRASFLPGKDATVKNKLEDLAMHEMDIGIASSDVAGRDNTRPGKDRCVCLCGAAARNVRVIRESGTSG